MVPGRVETDGVRFTGLGRLGERQLLPTLGTLSLLADLARLVAQLAATVRTGEGRHRFLPGRPGTHIFVDDKGQGHAHDSRRNQHGSHSAAQATSPKGREQEGGTRNYSGPAGRTFTCSAAWRP